VDSGRNADLRWSDFTLYKTEVAKLYATNGYSLLWVQNGRVRPQGLAVIELLQNAGLKGLDPEDYDGSRWQGRLLKLDQKKLDQKPSEQDLVSFDTALTVSAMRYVRAIHCGRVNPKEFKFQLDMGGEQLPLAEFIQTQVVNAGDPAAEIQKLEPPFMGYRKLLALLPVYEGYAHQAEERSYQRSRRLCSPAKPTLAWSAWGGFFKSSATFLQAHN
jgi:murein L,D-transpeptidase YcbB/YkuD